MTITDLDLFTDPRALLDGDDWRSLAACRDEDPELFYIPEGARRGAPATVAQLAAAKAVCAACPVRAACLRWALDTGEPAGVWGGLDEFERDARRRTT